MAKRPVVIAFDVIETLFPLEPRDSASSRMDSPTASWSSGSPGLRDAFALVASDSYRPFPEIAMSAPSYATGHSLTDAAARGIVSGFAELDLRPDVEPAMRRAHESGVRVVALTNGSAEVTDTLLNRAGVRQYVQQILSVDDVRVGAGSASGAQDLGC